MAKYISNRQQNLKIGIVSYTEDKTVLEVTGKVGIGTTNATSKLHVVGDVRISSNVTAQNYYGSGAYLTGISTFANANILSGIFTDLYVSGISTLGITSATNLTAQQLNVSGVSTLAGKIVSGNGIGNTNLANTLNYSASTGITAFRPISLVDSAAGIKISRTGGQTNGAALELQTWDVGIATNYSYWDVNAQNGYFGIRDVKNSRSRIFIDDSGSILLGATSSNFTTNYNQLVGVGTDKVLNVLGNSYISGSVGIGTTNATSKLHVVGDVRVTGVITATSFTGDGSQLTGIAASPIATYATNAGIATNVIGGIASVTSLSVSGISTLGTVRISSGIVTATSGVVTYYGDGSQLTGITASFIVGVTSYATNAGISTFATNAGIATFATSSGIATFATSSGIATFATSSGIATFATSSGISTFATNAGIATFATNAGISTSVIGGIGSITQLQVTGISTFTNGPILVGTGTSTGTASQPLQVTGGAYVSGSVGIGTTNPVSKLHVIGDARITGVVTATTFIGALTGTASSTTNIPNLTGAITSNNTTTSLGSFSSANLATALTDETGSGSAVFATSPTLVTPVLGAATATSINVSGIATINQLDVNQLSPDGSNYGTVLYVPVANGSGGWNWATVASAGAGNLNGIDIREEGTIVGTAGSTTSIDFRGNNIIATGTAGGAIATVRVSDTPTFDSLVVSSGSTFTNGPILVGTATSTGTTDQRLQVTGGGYVSGNLGIGTTNPTSKLHVVGDVNVSGVVTATTFVGALTGTATSTTNIPNLTGAITSNNTTTSLGSFTSANLAAALTDETGSGANVFATSPVLVTPSLGIATATSIVVSSGSTFTNGPILVGTATSTGTASQRLQVTGGGYVSGNLGIGTTNPTSKLHVIGDVRVSGVVTATTFVGALTGTATSTTNIPNLTGAITSVNTTTSLGSFTSANLSAALTDETGSGSAVFATSPVLVTPSLGIATATSINASGIITASQLSTGASGTGVNITTNTISGPATLTIDPAAVGDNTGAVRIKGDLYVDGTQFIVNSTTIELADFNVGIATTVGTNALLDGAGIGIGSTSIRKTLTWSNSSTALKSSEDFDVASGKVYKINGTSVLSNNTLGSGVVTSSLTSVGTLGQLQVTGVSTFTNGPILVGAATSTGTASQPLQVTGGAYVSGNLGIGTTNPVTKFHSYSTTESDNRFEYFTPTTLSTSTITAQFKTNATSLAVGARTGISFALQESTNNYVGAYIQSVRENASHHQGLVFSTWNGGAATPQDRVKIDKDGNLGIGTTNPTQKLQVYDGYINVYRPTGEVNIQLESGDTSVAVFRAISPYRNWRFGIQGGANADFVIRDATSSANRLGITSAGEVIIGSNTTPLVPTGTASQPLQVTGGAYVSGSVGIGTTNPGATLNVVPTSTGIAGLFSGTTSSDMVRITQLGTGNALVVEDSANPDSSPFVVTGIGSVGIGTASPAFAADIAGDARVTSTNKMRFGGTAGTTNFYIQYNSTANSLDFVAG